MGNIYDSPSWGKVVGRIENDGLVYDGPGLFAKCIGRVDENGLVCDGAGFAKCVGKFEADGKVYDGVGMFARYVGRVESDGTVFLLDEQYAFPEKIDKAASVPK